MKDRKDKLKAKTWEKDRRQRMDTCYKTLADLLPPHQEGRKRNKVEILLHATKYIRDLHNRTDELFCARGTTAHKEELARLKKLVTQLLSHNQLLSTLLKDAGITVPAEPALENISPKLWSNKITTDVTERYIKDQSKKAEKIKQRNTLKSRSKKNSSTLKSPEKSSVQKCFAEDDEGAIENQENCANGITNKGDDSCKSNSSTLTFQEQNGSKDEAVSSASSAVKTTAKRKGFKRTKKDKVEDKKSVSSSSGTITNLPPGALVFSGTKLMPVVTPMSQITSNLVVNQHQPPNPIIFNNSQQGQMIVNQHPSSNPIILSNTQQNQMIVNQHQHANSIILNNAQQNQMIVVHPLQANPVQNSVISLQNRATVTAVRNIIPSVPKIPRMSNLASGSKIMNVQNLQKCVTQEDLVSLRSIADNSKIGGHKAILPKSAFTKAITKTTMAYKVPIPAIRKEKVEVKEVEEARSKGKSSRATRQQKDNGNEKNSESSSDDKVSLKRSSTSSKNKTKESESKKRKLVENSENGKSNQVKITSIVEIPTSCKIIENIKQVVDSVKVDSERKHSEEILSPSGTATDNKSIESGFVQETFEDANNLKNSSINSDLGGKESNLVRIDNEDDQEQSQNLKKSSEPLSKQVPILEEASDTPDLTIEKEEISLPLTPMKPSIDDRKTEESIIPKRSSEVCDLDEGFDNILQVNNSESPMDEEVTVENNKIILNLDTNTTTTMKLESNEPITSTPTSGSLSLLSKQDETMRETEGSKEELKTLSYSSSSGFIPISSKPETLHSDLSNDIFASLQVPSSSHNPESISPTAAFLMAFPLVATVTGKTEVLEEEMKEDFKYQSQTPPMLLQIGTMEPNSFKIKSSVSSDIPENTLVKTINRAEEKSSEENKSLSKSVGSEHNKEQFKISTVADQSVISRSLNEVNPFPENSTSNLTTSAVVSSVDTIINPNSMIEASFSIPDKSQPTLNYTPISKCDILTTSVSTTSTPTKDASSTKYEITSRYLESQESQTECSKESSIRDARYEFHSEVPTSNSDSFNRREPEAFINAENKVVTFASSPSESRNSKLQDSATSSIDQKEKETNNVNSLESAQNPEQAHCKITEAMQIHVLDSYNRDSDSFNSILTQNTTCKIAHPNASIQVDTVQTSSPSVVQNASLSDSQKSVGNFSTTNPEVTFETPRSIYHSTVEEPVFSNTPENQNQNTSQKNSNETYPSKKLDSNELQQSVVVKKPSSNDPGPEIGNSTYQTKTEEPPSPYIVPYEKSGKKITTNAEANILSDKATSIANSYPQQQQSFVATSNYEESVVSRTQSTTTVAHNTSNYSILSWTTVPPVSGSNINLAQFEQGTNQTDPIQPKTICENFNYLPIHKDGFTNSLPTPSYTPDLQSPAFDKSRAKQSLEMHKRSYLDASKARNVRSIPVSQKQSRSQTQTQNQSQNPVPNSEYKYGNDSKTKLKYSTDLDYMQNDYSGIDSRQQQQHGSKGPTQTIPPVKQDKSNYMMPDYGVQSHFDPESQQARYNAEIYNPNFKYVDKSQHPQKYQPSSQANILQHDNTSYNAGNKQGQQQQSSIKSKSQHQQLQQQQTVRPTVNWMMTPEIKHNSNIPDIILPPIGKELDFCQNNLFSQTPTYNQSTPNQFYNNYDVTAHGFHNIPALQSDPKRSADSNFYPEEQPFSWSPTKNISQNVEQSQTLKSIDHQVVPSTLPTLVGDLALGTNLPDKQNFLFGQMPIRGSNNEQNKDHSKEKEGREFQTMLNTQNVQHAAQGMSFLSVSQLVEHEKAEKNQHQHHNHQQQHQQPRKHQRKSNTSPRNSAKRQMDIRKQTAVNDQLQRHEDHKPGSSFPDQNYQQQSKYHQNDWRSRNCKSNYTAEALISTNTNDTNNHDKNSAKYTTNYSQNKFPSSLPSTESMMSINYFPNVDDSSGYGQVVNQNFNHSYGYSSNANIYPTTNFITSISNTPTNYMMSLHENPEYLESNNFLLPPTTSNITTPTLANMTANSKNHQQNAVSKHQNCDKRLYPSVQKKGKRKTDGAVQNFEFPGITSPLDEYHHPTHFLPPHANHLYQNHPQANVYSKSMNTLPPPPPTLPAAPLPPPAASSTSLPPPIVSGSQGIPSASGIPSSNPMAMGHHPSGTSLINFNLSTIFPEMNDKNCYKSSANDIQPGLVQSSSHAPTSYPQRSSYTNSLVHMTQVSETMQFTSDVPRPPLSGVVHYKNP